MPTTVDQVRIIRIMELDTAENDILMDKLKTSWGMVEIDGKVYKFDLYAFVEAMINADPRIPKLQNQVAALEKAVKKLILGLDENEVLEV